jgi:hypothetical protein
VCHHQEVYLSLFKLITLFTGYNNEIPTALMAESLTLKIKLFWGITPCRLETVTEVSWEFGASILTLLELP